MQTTWKVVAAFLGVFVAGAVFGTALTTGIARRMAHRATIRTEPMPSGGGPILPPGGPGGRQVGPEMMQRFVQRLELTAEQAEKIRPIVQRGEAEVEKLRRENFREMAKVFERVHAEIAVGLTPAQREKLAELQKKFRERSRNFPMLRGGRAELVWCGSALYTKQYAARWGSKLRGNAA